MNTTTLTLEVGEDEACFLTTILPDDVYELTEELTLTISSVTPDMDVNDTSISLLIFDPAEGTMKKILLNLTLNISGVQSNHAGSAPMHA